MADLRLWEAAKEGDCHKIKEELANGADVNWQNPRSWPWDDPRSSSYRSNTTPLHAAMYRCKDLQVLKLLYESGARLDLKDSRGCTPLEAGQWRASRKTSYSSVVDEFESFISGKKRGKEREEKKDRQEKKENDQQEKEEKELEEEHLFRIALTSSSVKIGKALYKYDGDESQRTLSLHPDQTLRVCAECPPPCGDSKVDDLLKSYFEMGWLAAECDGCMGWVPASHVETGLHHLEGIADENYPFSYNFSTLLPLFSVAKSEVMQSLVERVDELLVQICDLEDAGCVGDVFASLFRGLVFILLGDINSAECEAEELVGKESQIPLIHVLHGRIALANGDESSAASSFSAFTHTVKSSSVRECLSDSEVALASTAPPPPMDHSSTGDAEADDTSSCAAKSEWEEMKRKKGISSPAMDELMKLIGLAKAKEYALATFKRIQKEKRMHKDRRIAVKLNFAFLGNPGTGKTEVARLFARVLHEAGARKKSDVYEYKATDLMNKSVDDFQKIIDDAVGGVLFIDEAYNLDPATNTVKGVPIYNLIMNAAEDKRDELSFIITGYRSEIEEKLYKFNPGFKSRFHDWSFEDYTEKELHDIWKLFVKRKKWKMADPNIELVVARRLARRRGRGFGNARDVRNEMDKAYMKAMSRPESDEQYTFVMEDIMGPRPSPETNARLASVLKEMEGYIGWEHPRKVIDEIISIAAENYDLELKAEEPKGLNLNRLFIGNPGTGKTEFASIYGRLLKELNLLSNGDVIVKSAGDFIGSAVGETPNKTKAILDNSKGKVLVIDEAYILDTGSIGYGGEALDTIVANVMGKPGDDIAVVMIGYERKILDMIRNQNAGLSRRFQSNFPVRFADFDDDGLGKIVVAESKKNGLMILPNIKKMILAYLARLRRLPNFGNAGEVKSLMSQIATKAISRVRESGKKRGKKVRVIAKDLPEAAQPISDEDSPLEELDKLFGMGKDNTVRLALRKLESSYIVAAKEHRDPPELNNFIFQGPPGTGKTTVARAMGRMLMKMKALTSGHVIETSAKDLHGTHVGDAQNNVRTKLEEALGGVLFIDEAYALADDTFGKEALDQLTAKLTDGEIAGNVCVILAGYKDHPTMPGRTVQNMLRGNPGAPSRFTKIIDFQPWKVDDCISFCLDKLNKAKFKVNIKAAAALRSVFEQLQRREGWANARDVQNLFKEVLEVRCERVRDAPEEVPSIWEQDVKRAAEGMISHRPVMGSVQSSFSHSFSGGGIGGMPRMHDPPTHDPRPATLHSHHHNEHHTRDGNDDVATDSARHIRRDVGVNDHTWMEVQHAREMREKEEAERQRKLEEENWRIAELKKEQERIERAKRAAEKAKREEEARKARKEAERIRRMLEEAERKARAIREAQEQARREQEALRRIGNCPAGYHWNKVAGGWRCDAGGHFVTDDQLNRHFTYYY